jgi:methylated-DNA-[protein]-cysteine S-methyltransferase
MKHTKAVSYCFIESPIGIIGLAWNEIGILRLQLPERTQTETRRRLLFGIASANKVQPVEPWVAETVHRVQAHLHGNLQSLNKIPLDLGSLRPFSNQVYLASQTIPAGARKTYGELAKQIGKPLAARAVGQALGRNPIALIIPCHRIIGANGKPGGFSAFGGLRTKERLLAIEGAI